MNSKRTLLLMIAVVMFLPLAIWITRMPIGAVQDKKIVVYYFHGEFRCKTCMRMEELTKKAVLGGFKKELSESKIELRVINVDTRANEHYTRQFKLDTKSVIVSEMLGDKIVRWKNCSRIWDLHSDEQKFVKYIQGEIKGYLK